MSHLSPSEKAEYFVGDKGGEFRREIYEKLSDEDKEKMGESLREKEADARKKLEDRAEWKERIDVTDESPEGKARYESWKRYQQQKRDSGTAVRNRELMERYNKKKTESPEES